MLFVNIIDVLLLCLTVYGFILPTYYSFFLMSDDILTICFGNKKGGLIRYPIMELERV